jgi:RNA polymerase sigma-70 factor (ECF subfamily)
VTISSRTRDDDDELLGRLRAGDEDAFMEIVMRYSPLMRRIALGYVRSPAVADEVVQEAWLGVLTGLGRFEGRASLKTWILRIVINQARTRAAREARSLPFSALAREEEDDGPAVDPSRFGPDGGWKSLPDDWRTLPEERLLAAETLAVVHKAADALPPRQREVFLLRDVEGWEPAEVAAALELSAGNERVLLHRARAKVRAALERELGEGEPWPAS